MPVWLIILDVFALLIAIILIISYICFRLAFYVPTKKGKRIEKNSFLDGAEFAPYLEDMKKWNDETENTPHEVLTIKSFDGLTLYGNYYEFTPNAPIEIMLHGYRGNAKRDLACGMQRAFKLGHSALIVDLRACGRSDGKVISFGINEYSDLIGWIDLVVEKFGQEVKIILCGISMGASTVLIASGLDLPKNVVGVLADCGFTTAKDIIKLVIKDMKLPPALSYPFVKLGARLFGGFNLEETSALQSVKNAKVPIIFFHGDSDNFVPSYMSEQNYNACASKKRLVIVKGAAHGLSYPVSPEQYINEAKAFFE